MHILFVCTGNICRSPTAERLARSLSVRVQLRDITASSAGTHAMIDHPIHPEAARFIAELGGDVADFAARQLTARIVSGADLVLTMTRAHRDAVLELAPHKLNRTFTLGEAALLATELDAAGIDDLAALRSHIPADRLTDIADPIGRSADFFAAVGAQIDHLLQPVLELCRQG